MNGNVLMIILVLCFGSSLFLSADGKLSPLHPHTHLTTTELITTRGYSAEDHEILTPDGYLLRVHRIPYGRTSSNLLGGKIQRCRNSQKQRQYEHLRPVIFLMHGVQCSSADFVLNDPHQALGFVLADMGYDVWMGNTRGNPYGRRHVSLSTQDPKFWDFSWDTISQYDMPAMLAYVRKRTGSFKIDYIGHSMGTTIFFTMMNYHPHINTWIRKMAALSPSAYIHNTFVGYKLLAPFYNFHNKVQRRNKFYSRLTRRLFPTRRMRSFVSKFCDPKSPAQFLCRLAIELIGGPSTKDSIDENYLPAIMAHTPAGGNSNIAAHYAQLVMAEKYQAFDHGRRKNMLIYGQPHPREFKLSLVTAPVGLFWSKDDWLTSPADVKRIHNELANVVLDYKVSCKRFNHLDFIWSERAYTYVYVPLMKFLTSDGQCMY